ncbi:MAG TPA: radical SAM protein, partial [Thermoanaerobaculia bacterium]|nr:radical SAM protein [Thermoanaerobaculia bacterium]
WKFYPAYAWECVTKLGRWFSIYAGLRWKYMRVKRDPRRLEYVDTALTPVTDEDQETLELFHETRPVVRAGAAAVRA